MILALHRHEIDLEPSAFTSCRRHDNAPMPSVKAVTANDVETIRLLRKQEVRTPARPRDAVHGLPNLLVPQIDVV